jgi:hypothetical protein
MKDAMERVGAIILCATFFAAAASASSLHPNREGSSPPIIVTRTGSLPRSCSGPGGVALGVLRFTEAFDLGKRRRLARFFDYYFQRYWVSEQTNRGWRGVTFSRKASLLRYIASRHARGEKLSPLIVAVNTFGPGLPQAVSISFWLTRTAPDLAAKGIKQPLTYGKGIIDCRRKTLIRFGFATPQSAPVPPPYWPYIHDCPMPADWDPTKGVIACVNQ